MGDRYTLQLKCAYCDELNDDVYYAPSCGFLSFKCQRCGNENWINQGFYVEKISKKELERRMFVEGFGYSKEEEEFDKTIGCEGCTCEVRKEGSKVIAEWIDNSCSIHGREERKKIHIKTKERLGIKEDLYWDK